jgi:RNA polymerase sigma-70 factor (TIGR02960 family)
MLASYHDAEDALQETLLRAWRALPGFEGRSTLRAWLYKIATNAALDVAKRRYRRELPVCYGPPVTAGGGPGAPLAETTWIEPYPDRQLVASSPEARYDQRESLEIAFVAALQTVPASQRAALLLREVLGFSATEIADQLGTSVPAVTSALQRARQGVQRRNGEPDQQQTLRTLGDKRVRHLVEAFVDALEQADVDSLVGLLTEDATWAMPPLPSWYGDQRPSASSSPPSGSANAGGTGRAERTASWPSAATRSIPPPAPGRPRRSPCCRFGASSASWPRSARPSAGSRWRCQTARLRGIALAGVFQIIITEAGRRTLEGQSQDQIADQIRPAIEAVLDDLNRWLAPAAK